MARPSGSRNADYDEARAALLDKLGRVLDDPSRVKASLRELAAAAGVTAPTLRHYFGDRAGLLRSVFEHWFLASAVHRAAAGRGIPGDVRASLAATLARVREGWTRFGVGRLQAAALSLGLTEAELGPSYVDLILEPTLAVVEDVLRRHVAHGDLAPLDERQAALMLLGPVILALLHQNELSGRTCRPLDLDAYLDAHVDAFLRAYPPRRRRTRRAG